MKKQKEQQSYGELAEIVTRVLCDTAPPLKKKADAAYLFGETKDNEDSAFAAALLLWRLGRVKKIAICDLGNEAGYPGVQAWSRKLVSLGIPSRDIIFIKPAKDFPPSTDAEAIALARHARKTHWKTVYVVAPPIHQLRAFVSAVSAAQREKAALKIYNFVGIPQRWEEHVVHSQGILEGTRSELIGKELEKIDRYCKEGTLLPAEKILAYLDKRDS